MNMRIYSEGITEFADGRMNVRLEQKKIDKVSGQTNWKVGVAMY